MATESKTEKVKQDYEKPILRIIDLVNEEVLAGACKAQTSGGPIPDSCQLCGILVAGS